MSSRLESGFELPKKAFLDKSASFLMILIPCEASDTLVLSLMPSEGSQLTFKIVNHYLYEVYIFLSLATIWVCNSIFPNGC